MKLNSLKNLYVQELRDLYNAENQLADMLPALAEGASFDELKQSFEDHLQQTREHIERLDEIFHRLGEKSAGKVCRGMKGLIEECAALLKEEGNNGVIDAGLIGAARRIEHYEIAAYGTVRTFAHLLGEEEAADLLQQTLDEEGEIDKRLAELAEEIVESGALTEHYETAPASSRWR
jgi:ferritin-like metal-binding protein YciE